METGQKELKTYLAHFGTKGQKHGLRRHQSYETAPTRSGMVGVEVGEAARQSDRLNRDNDRNDRNGPRRGPMQYEMQSKKPTYNNPEQLRKMSKKDILKAKLEEKKRAEIEKNKAEWAKSYKDLEKHKDAFTNQELRNALDRLQLTGRIKNDRWEQARNLTQKGADTMKNLASASQSFVNIYNVVAGGYNTYRTYQDNKKNKVDLLPKWNSGSGTFNINNNQQHKKDDQKKPKTIRTRNGRFRGHANHSGMSATEYIAHFGVPGQKWWQRHFQSYKTAPTRSGKVGEEIGLAAKQAERLGEDENYDRQKYGNAVTEVTSKKWKPISETEAYNYDLSDYENDDYDNVTKQVRDNDNDKLEIVIDSAEITDNDVVSNAFKLDKEWPDQKKAIMKQLKPHVVEDLMQFEDMERAEAEALVNKRLSEGKGDTYIYARVLPFLGDAEISIDIPGLYGGHHLTFEWDLNNKKMLGKPAMNG